VTDVIGENAVEAITTINNSTGEVGRLDVSGFFLAIGHTPNTAIFKDWLAMDKVGYLVHEPDSTRTKIPGVFVAGDAADHVYRQAVTAAGTGCMAALDAERYLAAKEIPVMVSA
ncbi:MAG: NAD(P)/FAD-dependent oxidoreductase, partial [Bacteroidota bacterium]|nr:NAD(P)/FAD-dependent oxidoreductase [Bacteroidota bacterium]